MSRKETLALGLLALTLTVGPAIATRAADEPPATAAADVASDD